MRAKSFLIDTHIILWVFHQSQNIPTKAKQAIADANNQCFVSLASLWEITIKNQTGKLKIPKDFYTQIHSKDFTLLPITETHIQALSQLPPIHKDPFDRMLASQALAENFTLITVDKNLLQYPIKTLSD
jgi:PIN domain nuclease of toxin-antitoxin system